MLCIDYNESIISLSLKLSKLEELRGIFWLKYWFFILLWKIRLANKQNPSVRYILLWGIYL